MPSSQKLREVALVFFKLGCFAFGGPAAHIALMEEEIVTRRKWISRSHFLDLIGATNLIPGPNSTEMTMHCGYERAGRSGLVVAGLAFIIPATLITGVLGWLYLNYGDLPEVTPWLLGIRAAVLSIVASAILKLGRKALKSWELLILGVLVLTASLMGVHEILALLIGGVLGMLYFTFQNSNHNSSLKNGFPFLILVSAGSSLSKMGAVSIFWTFLKIGATLYGSGYVLFAYLDAELVSKGVLNSNQLMEAIGVGQFTPGPVLSTATFIGFQLNGFWGALAATTGIFLPSFLFVWFLNPFIPRLRQSRIFSCFLDSVNVAAIAVMVAVLCTMVQATLTNFSSFLLAGISAGLVFIPKKLSVLWVIVISGILGFIFHFFA